MIVSFMSTRNLFRSLMFELFILFNWQFCRNKQIRYVVNGIIYLVHSQNQKVRDVSFSKSFAHVPNGRPLLVFSDESKACKLLVYDYKTILFRLKWETLYRFVAASSHINQEKEVRARLQILLLILNEFKWIQ